MKELTFILIIFIIIQVYRVAIIFFIRKQYLIKKIFEVFILLLIIIIELLNMHYIDRKSVKDLSHNDKSNEFLLCIFFDEEEPSVFDFQDAWEEELKNLFPTSCKFKFEKDLIVFTIPEFE